MAKGLIIESDESWAKGYESFVGCSQGSVIWDIYESYPVGGSSLDLSPYHFFVLADDGKDDGSVYKLTNQNSHQICFTNVNKFLLNDVRNSLLSLGIKCSQISVKDVYITKKSELRKFLKLIGFKNSRHLKKIKLFKLDR